MERFCVDVQASNVFHHLSETSVSQLRNLLLLTMRRSNQDYVGSAMKTRRVHKSEMTDYISPKALFILNMAKRRHNFGLTRYCIRQAACLIISDKVPMNQLLCLLDTPIPIHRQGILWKHVQPNRVHYKRHLCLWTSLILM